ncbi:cell wall-binding repeat-containing protein [Phycicoccus sp. MAQZ13P-2]|uniref:cell wall-binding repeat-containing protein n=1 Tax=Phycicoccus mangrovi TaxID=2840470 RepID=UPI001C001D10|nr:cell wall-binding repeat-containing protein [Phycicoccus mangrovi]MBT9255852.1 cell wall-binding repeat-containing protein [Phycicoccus mangrovi]MBT9274446.1 cell wall-binding repeat-containing protein [Phycicoccus mangrovi]
MHRTFGPAVAAAALTALVVSSGGTASAGEPAGRTDPAPVATTPADHHAFVRALHRARATDARSALAAVLTPPPPPAALWVSDGVGTTRVSFKDANGAVGTTSPRTDRTDVAVGPAGDTMAYRAGGLVKVEPLPLGTGPVVDHPASNAPVAWGPAGDAFALTTDAGLFAQSTNPDYRIPFDSPTDATSPAVSPYGGELFLHTGSGATSDITGIAAPFIGTFSGSGTHVLGLSAYRPEAPGVGQEPGTGIVPGANDGATYLAFEGVGPGGSGARLYVDHQDTSGSPDTTGYGTPVAVADVGTLCGVAAPVFSPDRTWLAYVRPNGPVGNECSSFQVRLHKADSSGRYSDVGADTLLASPATKPTLLSFEPRNPAADPYRIDGANRYEVSANTAAFYDPATSEAAVVAGAYAEADALAGGPLATENQGPLLLTDSRALRPETALALTDSLAKGKKVYILGSTTTVPASIESAIRALGYSTQRIGGANRFEVAVNVAKEMDRLRGGNGGAQPPTAAFVSSGWAFADALVAGPPATAYDAPILLTNGSKLPDVVRTYLGTLAPTASIFAIGGSGKDAVVGDSRTEVVDGANRYEVAANVAQRFFAGWWVLALADGRNWPDAASAGSLMGLYGQPILLTNGKTTLPAGTEAQIRQTEESIDNVLVFGGTPSVPQGAMDTGRRLAGNQTSYYGPAFTTEQ